MERDQPSIEALSADVRAWIAADPDPETRHEAESLLRAAIAGDAEAYAELAAAFSGRLSFGTAGLRARLGAGPKRMNRVVVTQTSAGFAAFLLQRAAAGRTTTPPSVVVGYDARINSDVFARDAAEIFRGAGLRVWLMPNEAPTPLTAFTVRQLGASAGVMITASHNPPRDNGYKVYLGDADGGSQISSPDDHEIAELISVAAKTSLSQFPRSRDFEFVPESVVEAFIARTVEAVASETPRAPLRTVYTAMHGVGSALSQRIFMRLGVEDLLHVPEQDAPDGRFPTLQYPNPEEPGALDLAYEFARQHHAELIIAQDPDADRLAIAAPHPAHNGEYRRLSGNELGLLLGWRAAERAHAAAQRAGHAPQGTLVNTIVSSPALGAVAAAYGLAHIETLSGFKWVSRVPDLIFGFEESLGYLCTPQVLRDKDGISAAVDAYLLASELHAQGRTLWDRLDEASERFGHFASRQLVLRFGTPAEVSALTARLRADVPTEIAGMRVEQLRDLSLPDTTPVPADVLNFALAGGSRVMIRPSGTEPKLKVYLDVRVADGTAAERRRTAEAALDPIEQAVRAYLEGLLP